MTEASGMSWVGFQKNWPHSPPPPWGPITRTGWGLSYTFFSVALVRVSIFRGRSTQAIWVPIFPVPPAGSSPLSSHPITPPSLGGTFGTRALAPQRGGAHGQLWTTLASLRGAPVHNNSTSLLTARIKIPVHQVNSAPCFFTLWTI